jgi:hypothetical protein
MLHIEKHTDAQRIAQGLAEKLADGNVEERTIEGNAGQVGHRIHRARGQQLAGVVRLLPFPVDLAQPDSTRGASLVVVVVVVVVAVL